MRVADHFKSKVVPGCFLQKSQRDPVQWHNPFFKWGLLLPLFEREKQ